MNPMEWKRLPELIRRCDVVAVGIPPDSLADLRFEITSATDAESVPFGRIGAIRGLGRNRGRNGHGNFMYLRSTVSRLLGKEWRE